MTQLEPITWRQANPRRFEWELSAMRAMAPDLEWNDDLDGWRGNAPLWPFERLEPESVADFVGERRLEIAIIPMAAHPAVPPKVWPLNPKPRIEHCTDQRWHTLGDGSLCIVQEYATWTGDEPCAALIPTAAGWFLEYQLMLGGVVDAMTVSGIETSDELDHLFTAEHHVSSLDH